MLQYATNDAAGIDVPTPADGRTSGGSDRS
jgi:hypothetical protein